MRGRKHPRLGLDGFEYSVHKKEPTRTRWRCTQEGRTKCAAVLYTSGNVVEVRRGHNHPISTWEKKDEVRIPKYVTIRYNVGYILYQKYDNKTRWRCNHFPKTKSGCKAALFTSVLGIYLKGKTKTPSLYTNGYRYIKHRSSNTATYWKCEYYDRGSCPARCVIYYNQSIRFSENHHHKVYLEFILVIVLGTKS
ncbi:hypothetical protein GWI33_002750 [Rhynchophorus ferrugineus]|uniref:FLYWCH-type domain-containing protein n=1 Tax=Rhynchophorus ferrugineus TaxID=354439 RepID=A0A834MG83_RHYFE|nr:hypothetical protein GWI33_002750 [Rhynchophorus ferrugineus]